MAGRDDARQKVSSDEKGIFDTYIFYVGYARCTDVSVSVTDDRQASESCYDTKFLRASARVAADDDDDDDFFKTTLLCSKQASAASYLNSRRGKGRSRLSKLIYTG
jgi:hypothetical protein